MPTLAPYFREVLTEHLGIPLEFSVDPLTVVSRGAAVFAGTQRIAKDSRAKAKVGQFDIALNYNPVGPDEDPRISGEVASADVDSMEGYTIEISNRTTGAWRSGKITLDEDGKFSTRLMAEPGEKNIFDLILCSPTGTKQDVVPSQFGYTIGVSIKEQIVCNDILLEKLGNEVVMMVERGTPYPFNKKQDFITAVPLRKGTDDVLKIPVLESKGPYTKADHCVKLGECIITGRQVRFDVPIGSDVEVRLSAKEPGTIVAKALIACLDEEFETLLKYAKETPDLNDLEGRLNKMNKELEILESNESNLDPGKLDKADNLATEAREKLNAAGDDDAARQARDCIANLRFTLDNAAADVEWPKRVDEAVGYLAVLDDTVRAGGTTSQKTGAENLRKLVEKAIEKHNVAGLERAVEKVRDFYFPILFNQPDFLKGYISYLYQKRAQMQDVAAANRLFNQGAAFIEKNDVDGMRRIIPQLLQLLPEDVKEEVQRGFGSGIK